MLTVTHFKQHTLKAVDKYESHFNRKNPMSYRRALEVIELRYCLKEQEFENLEHIIAAIEKILHSMHTGFWIFKTGKSRLKSLIENVIAVYQSPLMQIANTAILELTDSLERTQLTLDKVSFMTVQLANNFKSGTDMPHEVPLTTLSTKTNEEKPEKNNPKVLLKTRHVRSTTPFVRLPFISKFFGHSELQHQAEEPKVKANSKLLLN